MAKFIGLIWFLACVFFAAWVGAVALKHGILWSLMYFCAVMLLVRWCWNHK